MDGRVFRGIPFAAIATQSSTPSRSAAASATRSPVVASATRSGSRSPVVASATPSRTATATQPLCRAPVNNITVLRGTSGSAAPLTSSKHGNSGMYTSGTCLSGFRTFFPGPRLVYALYLGASTPLGGTLTITTCGRTANNTVLYVGTGCPTWSVPFNCLAGSDNDATCGLASRIVLTGVSQNTYFIQLAGYAGQPVTSGLAWSYAIPSKSPTPSRTKSRKPKA